MIADETQFIASAKTKPPALKKFFASDPRVLGVWLFGSQADGMATARSDIDFVVLFDRSLTLDEELTFEVTVCDTLGSYDNVDIVNLNRASLLFQFRAISSKLLYERDYARVSDFIERVLIEYPDYIWFLNQFDRDYVEGMREDYGKFRQPEDQRAPKNHRKQLATARSQTR